MRFPLEVSWSSTWILVVGLGILWTQALLTVGVYVVEDPIPLVDSAGHTETYNMEDTSRTPEDPMEAEPEPDRTRTNSAENMDNIEGPISGIVTPERLPVHCVELRSKRYISDGFCTSLRPITEVVCAGSCIPEDFTGWYFEHIKVWGHEKRKEYRCVNDSVRQKKVHLICDNDQTRTYRIKTVRSCKCKRLNQQHNESQRQIENVSPRQSSNRRNGRNKRNKKANRQ